MAHRAVVFAIAQLSCIFTLKHETFHMSQFGLYVCLFICLSIRPSRSFTELKQKYHCDNSNVESFVIYSFTPRVLRS